MENKRNLLHLELVDAVYAQEIGAMAERMLERRQELTTADRSMLLMARNTCKRIREQSIQIGEELVRKLSNLSISCTFDPSTLPNYPQFHRLSLALAVENPRRALEFLMTEGYWHPLSTSEIQWQSHRDDQNEISLTQVDDFSTRVDLRWRALNKHIAGNKAVNFALTDPATFLAVLVSRITGRLHSSQKSSGLFLGDLLSTPQDLIPEILRFSEIDRDDILIDIGCGDGRVVIEASRTIGCRSVGVEHDAGLCALAHERVHAAGLGDKVNVVHADAAQVALGDATVIFLFVPMHALSTYLPKLISKLSSGTKIVAHEQVALDCELPPEKSSVLIADSSVTVAHIWQVY